MFVIATPSFLWRLHRSTVTKRQRSGKHLPLSRAVSHDLFAVNARLPRIKPNKRH
jgi:hypothetical protein